MTQLEMFLDKQPENNQEWAAQQLAILSPTELREIARVMRRIEKALYKTFAKDMTWREISNAIKFADGLKNPLDTNEEMENSKPVRRRGRNSN